jgi:hypothetical protein
MLAMEVNGDAGSLTPRGALGFLASMLAPTVEVSMRHGGSPGSHLHLRAFVPYLCLFPPTTAAISCIAPALESLK